MEPLVQPRLCAVSLTTTEADAQRGAFKCVPTRSPYRNQGQGNGRVTAGVLASAVVFRYVGTEFSRHLWQSKSISATIMTMMMRWMRNHKDIAVHLCISSRRSCREILRRHASTAGNTISTTIVLRTLVVLMPNVQVLVALQPRVYVPQYVLTSMRWIHADPTHPTYRWQMRILTKLHLKL